MERPKHAHLTPELTSALTRFLTPEDHSVILVALGRAHATARTRRRALAADPEAATLAHQDCVAIDDLLAILEETEPKPS